MNRPAEPLAPAQFDAPDDPIRADLHAKLGLSPFLARREAFRVGPDGVHCEYYHHADDAPLLLFLPGMGTYCELYAELLASLSAKGFNVAGVDPRGHGYSAGRRGEYTVEQMVCDLERVVTALQPRSNGRVAVYGYSIGAMLAVALAERDERIAAVLCGTLLLTEVPPDMMHQFGWFWTWGTAQLFPSMRLPLKSIVDIGTWLSGHPAGETINADRRVVFDYPLSTLSSLFTHRAGVATQHYDFQAAIIQGERDEVLSLEYTRRVVDTVAHPFELISLPGEGHMLPWDNPHRLTALAADWLQRALG